MKKPYLPPTLRPIVVEHLLLAGSITSDDLNPAIDNLHFYEEEVMNPDDIL